MDFQLFLRGVLFGIALAMDAFSISVAQGLREPEMRLSREMEIAGVFGAFQMGMPLLGWGLVSEMERVFSALQPWIPWVALALLLFLGGRMLAEGLRNRGGESDTAAVTGLGSLLALGVATSIDALSVGLTMAELPPMAAVTETGIIGAVTFGICFAGLRLGRKIGGSLRDKAPILGGLILIGIGIEIFLQGVLG